MRYFRANGSLQRERKRKKRCELHYSTSPKNGLGDSTTPPDRPKFPWQPSVCLCLCLSLSPSPTVCLSRASARYMALDNPNQNCDTEFQHYDFDQIGTIERWSHIVRKMPLFRTTLKLVKGQHNLAHVRRRSPRRRTRCPRLCTSWGKIEYLASGQRCPPLPKAMCLIFYQTRR